MAALRTVDTAITSSFDLKMTLNVLLDVAMRQLDVDAICILLVAPHFYALEYAVGRGFRGDKIEKIQVRFGENLAGQAVVEQRVVSIPDISTLSSTSPQLLLLKDEHFVSYYGVPLINRGSVKGVLEIFHRTQLTPDKDWLIFLESLGKQAAIAIDNAQLFAGLQRSNSELSLAYDATIEGWSKALDFRDKETEGHSQRVTELTLHLARLMNYRDEDLVHVRRGALLHDIGKMGIPDRILLKPDKLTDEEWVVMQKHPGLAYEMLSPIAYLHNALDIPYCHHEKWDGSGYPRGLKGEEIPQSARIFAVVDVWDALRSDRPYRAAWPEEKVRAYIYEHSAIDFDPKVVEAFLKLDTSRFRLHL
jgi:putative nucleotidyltransferase with HDIG domain